MDPAISRLGTANARLIRHIASPTSSLETISRLDAELGEECKAIMQLATPQQAHTHFVRYLLRNMDFAECASLIILNREIDEYTGKVNDLGMGGGLVAGEIPTPSSSSSSGFACSNLSTRLLNHMAPTLH